MLSTHKKFLQEALRLAQQGLDAGDGGPFGAVVVKDGEIIGRGWNRVLGSNDPTAHAEVTAIREACAHLGSFQLDGCVIYSSCEPCPMCLGAIYWARPAALYFAATREDAAAAGFDDAHIYHELPLPLEQRSIPMQRIPLEGSDELFRQWLDSPDRIPY